MTKRVRPAWQPTGLVEKSFCLASKQHKNDVRKGGEIPYISHLLAVSALVIENGGTEVQAAAALLHDVVEDTRISEKRLANEVGQKVASIVVACSSKRFGEKKEPDPWTTKKRYLKKLKAKSTDDPSLLVALADKVHNSESCVNEYPKTKSARRKYWKKFNAGYRVQKKWYTNLYREFALKDSLPEPLMKRLRVAIKILFK